MDLSKYTFSKGEFNNQKVLWIQFDYSKQLKNELKAYLPNARWSPIHKSWWVKDIPYYRNRLREALESKMHSDVSAINQDELKRFIEQLQLKGYSKNTIKTYSGEFTQFLLHIEDKSVENMGFNQIRAYILYCINKLKLSENTIHSRINALKFYYEQILHHDRFFLEIPRPKKPKSLPKVLSQREIVKLFGVVRNKKHLVLLKLCYGMGLRVSELAVLEIQDIDSTRMLVHIRNSKNKRDRYVNLPQSILNDLREYYREYKPKKFLFEGQYPNTSYSVRSIQQVFMNALKKAKINKKVGIHGLRHSYATHLLEMGTDISLIQKLMGHRDIKTTLLYTDISDKNIKQVKSPLDRLQ